MSEPTSAAAAAPTRPDLPSLTGVRGIAAGAVFVGHAALASAYRDDTLNFALTGLSATVAHAAVSLFFALSGFVLAWSYRPGDTASAFMRRRIAKIGPNHVVTWTAGLVLLLIVGTSSGAATLLPSLFLVHAWVPQLDVVVGTNGPNWSLSAELFFYATFPLLLPAIARLRGDRLWRWVSFLMVGSMLVPVASLLIPADPILYDIIPVNRFWFIAFFPLSRMFEFVIGIIVARMVLEGRWKPVRPRTLWLTFGAAWVVAAATPPPYAWVAPFLLPIALGVGTMATRDLSGTTGWVGSRRMVWFGQVSFAFYLVHSLVIEYGHRLFGGAAWGYGAGTAFIVGTFAVSIGLALGLRHSVEIPAYRRWSGSHPAASRAQATAVTESGALGRLVDRELHALANSSLAAVPRAAARADRPAHGPVAQPVGFRGEPTASPVVDRPLVAAILSPDTTYIWPPASELTAPAVALV